MNETDWIRRGPVIENPKGGKSKYVVERIFEQTVAGPNGRAMTEEEKQIVAWLRKQASLAIQAGPDLDACMKTSIVFTTIADAIERGDHRQHSPAKDDGK